jgi:hypothetical protein
MMGEERISKKASANQSSGPPLSVCPHAHEMVKLLPEKDEMERPERFLSGLTLDMVIAASSCKA